MNSLKEMASVAIMLGALLLGGGCAEQEDIRVKTINTGADGIALGGYDAVSYFDGTATPGNPAITADWQNATFQFANPRNRDKFLASPIAFAPEYGGYCSFGMGFGEIADADPEAFIVQDNKLHLNASPMVLRFWRWFGNPDRSEAKWQAFLTQASKGQQEPSQ